MSGLEDVWIVVPNWAEFQHYRNRSPVWIKAYTALLDNPEWCTLTVAEQGILLNVWLLYARTEGRLSYARLTREIRPRLARKHFDRLCDAGFVVVSASKPLAQRQRQRQKGLRAVTSEVDANGNGLDFQIRTDLLQDVPR